MTPKQPPSNPQARTNHKCEVEKAGQRRSTCQQALILFLTSFIVMPVLSFATPISPDSALTCAEFPYFKPKRGPLALLNCDMHKAYEFQIDQIMRTFGSKNGRPVIINLGNTLILKYNGEKQVIDINPATYHEIKAFCHGALSIVLILTQQKERKLDKKHAQLLKQLQRDFETSLSILSDLDLTNQTKSDIKELVSLSEGFITKTLQTSQWTHVNLSTYYNNATPLIDKLLYSAAKIEISFLNNAIDQWLAPMSFKERSMIGIAIATVHQARANEISLQYFIKKFHKQVGIGALNEDGMVVIEDQFDENKVLQHLARNYLDREAAQFIFNQPGRLQEDALSNAGEKILDKMDWKN